MEEDVQLVSPYRIPPGQNCRQVKSHPLSAGINLSSDINRNVSLLSRNWDPSCKALSRPQASAPTVHLASPQVPSPPSWCPRDVTPSLQSTDYGGAPLTTTLFKGQLYTSPLSLVTMCIKQCFFHSLAFSLCVSPNLKQISCTPHIVVY